MEKGFQSIEIEVSDRIADLIKEMQLSGCQLFANTILEYGLRHLQDIVDDVIEMTKEVKNETDNCH